MLGIRTWSDLRAFLHVLLPAVAASSAVSGLITEEQSLLWVALISAILDPALSFFYSAGFRQALYGVLVAINGVLIGVFKLYTEADIEPWLPLIPILLGGGVAAANTPTTIDANARKSIGRAA